jgi:phosphopantothenoylcysteine decarboxylase/phosphopantothenate--cysteine ligase
MKENELKKVALGVSSSISIYKSCEIVRRFQKEMCEVRVLMTKNAARMISPLLFSALTGQEVLEDPLGGESSQTIPHISLAQEASLLLVVPATANIIGKFASGVADDFLSTFFMAVRCPVLIAPAMNQEMYFHRQTQENIRKLKAGGIKFLEPEKGYLACKEEGWGRLASVDRIVEEGMRLMEKSESLKGKTVVVTAGPTREFLDPVRFLTNRSSGKMGFEIAEEATKRGASVVLVSGPTHLPPPPQVTYKTVQTSGEMGKEVKRHFKKADVVVMAAAVSDFKFARISSQKIKKKEWEGKVSLQKTEDVLKSLGQKKGKKILVGFAAETEDVVANALRKIKEKNLDLAVANNVLEEGVGFESDYNRAEIVYPHGKVLSTGKMSKREISEIILDKIEELIGQRS